MHEHGAGVDILYHMTRRSENMDTNYSADIPRSTAIAAFSGTSWTPEDRADSILAEYQATLETDYTNLAQYADTDEKRAILDDEFVRYRDGYRKRYLAWLHSRSRCLSAAITGPANFPTARNSKSFRAEMKRMQEYAEYRKRALDAIEKRLRPELRPVMSGDADAVERLQEKIEKAERLQEKMRAANKLLKRKAGPDREGLKALGYSDAMIAELLMPDFCGRMGYADFELTNNGANIRRMKERLEIIKQNQAIPETENESTNGITMTDCPAENRVRLAFPGKPDESVRTELKRHGFRWAPSLGVWQAYRNWRSIEYAKGILS